MRALLILAAFGTPVFAGQDWYFKDAGERERKGDVTGAIQAAKLLTVTLPRDPKAWVQLAGLHGKAHQYAEQADAARKAIALDPTSAPAQLNLGNAALELGKMDDARKAYARAAALAPRDPRAPYGIGLVEERSGNFAKATAHYLAAVKADPTFEDGYLNLAAAYGNLGKLDEAKKTIERLLKVNPSSAEAKRMLSEIESAASK